MSDPTNDYGLPVTIQPEPQNPQPQEQTESGRWPSRNPSQSNHFGERYAGRGVVAVYGTALYASMAAAVTNNRGPNDPEGVNWDELADWSGVEERLLDAMNYPVGVGKTHVIDSLSMIGNDDIYLRSYGGPVGGSGKGNKGQTTKALTKRRKANKAARKARRK